MIFRCAASHGLSGDADLLGRKYFAAEVSHQAFEAAQTIFVDFGNDHSTTWVDFAGDVIGKLSEITPNAEIGGIADHRSAGSHDRRGQRTGRM
jgi:hypothetical protein